MKLTFLGATGTVTGSKYLLNCAGQKVLIDCGLFQGLKELRLRNWDPLPINPAQVDAILLTHAHLDHSGYIPKLVKDGFKGPIYCSEATYDLCKILLPDSGHIQEEDADFANRHGYSKHKPALALYTKQDALDCLNHFKPVSFGQPHALDDETHYTLHRAGHILGAASIRVQDGSGTSVLFSGDIGRTNDPVMKTPAQIQDADYLVVESTYGNRRHEASDPLADLQRIILETLARGGTLVIPAFAVGRCQTLLYYIHKLKSENRIPASLPVYLDSPMAIDVSTLMSKHTNDHRLPPHLCKEVCNTATFTRTVEESKAIDNGDISLPKIIISASGMATGGRVLHHLTRFVGDPRSTVLLAGFQAAGTRGDRLARGESEIKIHGQLWPVRARIERMDNLSAHADYEEMLDWMSHISNRPRKVFVTHGETDAAQSMRQKIEERFGWNAVVPHYQQTEEM